MSITHQSFSNSIHKEIAILMEAASMLQKRLKFEKSTEKKHKPMMKKKT